jgi:SAM-dependent methyltransferase
MPSSERDDAFRRAQARHFAAADAAHFEWQVAGPGFAPLEAALLEPVARAYEAPFLEVGCGEGASFVHVGGRGLRVGVDGFPEKLAFARSRVPDVGFVAADAAALALRTASVRTALVRDVLHHVADPAAVVAEVVRVLAPGGRLFVIEPNGANPLVALQALVVSAEAGVRASRRETLEVLLAAQPLDDVRVEMRQPLPLRRLVLHYRFGVPRLGGVPLAARALAGLEAALGRLVPERRWSYVCLSARRR